MKNKKRTVDSLSKVCYGLLAVIMGAILAQLLHIDPLVGGLVFGFISVLSPTPKISSTLYTVTQNPLIGRAKNKAGGMVFTTWKGKNIIKTKPLTVAQPPSDTRSMQQSIIRQLVALGRPILTLIRKAFKEVSTGSTEWASYIKYNADEAFDTTSPPTAALIANRMSFAKGTLINPSDLGNSFTLRVGTITWTDNSSASGNSATDQLNVIAITDTGELQFFNEIAVRSAETATFTLTGLTTVADFSIYGFFTTPSGSKAGDSVLLP